MKTLYCFIGIASADSYPGLCNFILVSILIHISQKNFVMSVGAHELVHFSIGNFEWKTFAPNIFSPIVICIDEYTGTYFTWSFWGNEVFFTVTTGHVCFLRVNVTFILHVSSCFFIFLSDFEVDLKLTLGLYEKPLLLYHQRILLFQYYW